MAFDAYESPAVLRRRKEKQALRRRINGIGVAFLAMCVVMTQWSRPLITALRRSDAVWGTRSYDWFVAFVRNNVTFNLVQVIVSAIAFLVPFGILAGVWKLPVGRQLAFPAQTDRGLFAALTAVGVGVCGIANWATATAGSFFEDLGVSYEADLHDITSLNGWGVVLTVLSTAIMPALVEELAMRGVVLGALRPFGDSVAILVSSLLFGLMHGNLEQIPFAVLLGLYFGFVTVKTGNLWCGILIHFINNLCSTLLSVLELWLPRSSMMLVGLFYVPLLCLVGLLGIRKLPSRKDLWQVSDDTGLTLTGRDRLSAVLSSAMLWVCVAAVVYEIFFVYMK